MEADGQFSKLVSDIPNPDIAISMGCNVGCPFIGRPFDDNWGLEDPTGKSDEEFKIVIEKIRKDILKLKNLFSFYTFYILPLLGLKDFYRPHKNYPYKNLCNIQYIYKIRNVANNFVLNEFS